MEIVWLADYPYADGMVKRVNCPGVVYKCWLYAQHRKYQNIVNADLKLGSCYGKKMNIV